VLLPELDERMPAEDTQLRYVTMLPRWEQGLWRAPTVSHRPAPRAAQSVRALAKPAPHAGREEQ
jgi:hypothetical protein